MIDEAAILTQEEIDSLSLEATYRQLTIEEVLCLYNKARHNIDIIYEKR